MLIRSIALHMLSSRKAFKILSIKLSVIKPLYPSIKWILKILGGQKKRWLLVFDSADDPDIDNGKNTPNSSYCCVSSTNRVARNREIQSTGEAVEVAKLDENFPVQILLATID